MIQLKETKLYPKGYVLEMEICPSDEGYSISIPSTENPSYDEEGYEIFGVTLEQALERLLPDLEQAIIVASRDNTLERNGDEMKKPEFVTCYDCEHFYWYAGKCIAYDEPDLDEFDGVEDEAWWSTFCPESIDFCTRFGLKHIQEPGSEQYDPLPSVEIIMRVRNLYVSMCNNLIDKIIKEEM